MPKRFVREIDKLKKGVLGLSALVEESVWMSIKALHTVDVSLAEKVFDHDDEIDQAEVDLEEECLKVLALYQPVATDLRYVVAILKMNNDLERIGDLAKNIADRVRLLSSQPRIDLPFDYPKMANKVQDMLRKCLDALMKMDSELALQVMKMDQEIDIMHREVYVLIKDRIRSNTDELDALIYYLAVSRNLERIADHTTNIAEDVVYLLEGYIVRHTDVDGELDSFDDM